MISQSHNVVSRFAPSPTGRMHLGNIFTALISWLVAKKSGGKWLLRIEDLDPQRSRVEYAELIEDDLHWLGLDWDEGGLDSIGANGPYIQSQRGDIYENALKTLADKGLVYPCSCSKADIAATDAPHASDGRIIYPGTCRPKENKYISATGKPAATRLLMPECVMQCNDLVFGQFSSDMTAEWGDIVLRRADGAWAYQLAVVVDDAAMGVTHVVRGADLLQSIAPQKLLASLLGVNAPEYIHLPLICNSAGLRLSKRDSSLAMDYLRTKFSPGQIVGKLAFLAGLTPDIECISPNNLIEQFDISRLPAKEKILLGE